MAKLSETSTPYGSVNSGWGGRRGASMVIVVVAMLSMLGAAAFSIDIGSAWALRRNLITGTDAAALAVAADYASNTANLDSGVLGCDDGTGYGTDDYFLTENAGSATVLLCDPHVGGDGTGWVSVSAEQLQESYFGSALGLADFDVPSFTAAQWGQISAATGLRPFGICAGVPAGGPTPTTPPWLASLFTYLGDPAANNPTDIIIRYGKDVQTDPCNEPGGPSAGSGNWGTLDLDDPVICPPAWDPSHLCQGNPNPNPDLAYWTGSGYDRPIEAGIAGETCISGSDREHCFYGDSGADMNSNGVKTALNTLIVNETWFTLPLFDSTQGTGANTEFHLFQFVSVRVLSYCFTTCSPNAVPLPPCSGAQCGWFIQLRFAPHLVTGPCCGPTPPGGVTAPGVGMCAVDPNAASANC